MHYKLCVVASAYETYFADAVSFILYFLFLRVFQAFFSPCSVDPGLFNKTDSEFIQLSP